MTPQRPRQPASPAGSRSRPEEARQYAALLQDQVAENIVTAQEQTQRARQLVANSLKIMARVKLSMARARKIHEGIGGPALGPGIAPAAPRKLK